MAVSSKIEAKTPQVSDTNIQPFLQPDFDPAEYLNAALPTLSTTSGKSAPSLPLPELSSQLQTLLNQLNAQTTRLSQSLTQLTDDIIRSGSRLAYEVEVLKGETVSLADTFQNGLRKDIEQFVPPSTNQSEEEGSGAEAEENVKAKEKSQEPEFLVRLRTLTTVRERLDTVIKTFGSAMQWPLAPSELSLASSLISVSAPESNDDSRSREEKGKEYTEKLRTEISDLLATGAEGVETANARVSDLRALADVWKGTAEEKARLKLVDSLQKLVDDRQKTLGRSDTTAHKPGISPARAMDYRYGAADPTRIPEGGSGYGFLQNLRNLKNEVYLDG
ncbi:uncharacterized protein MYCFIDRAFT_47048 [Pseudocercospora fijiensis CIRAD86]|uniref:Uncharacterized protein n=1 Tax=Pseudocercospora fijiensis (strain CIRAD86) TaxID=383855 RepID=M3B2M0_PSEFD|nr:uncharacterized protein MYCFIDRAFT_47048 [Pseudocercospora fijiensis CIRAD86]EME83613.1 hypothetical protein MYCFIDRAFT_47048 [Pseudocercospora fijiensis CIRAD86]